ncbi:MAG: tetratricopeptide repeat protein [Rhodospirillales bacterium]|nr:tetratricopeptide repeat protein [Rhodospirillales bacterium]
MSDIFDEINEDLRAERMAALARRYGWLVAVAVLAVLLGAGGWQGWRWYQARQDNAAATAYLNAADAAAAIPHDPAARQAAMQGLLGLAQHGPAGYRTLARLRAAALDADGGDQAQALALWNAVAADQAADPLMRDLANLLWAMHQVDHGDPALVGARLKALTVPANPFAPLAREQLALLDLRLGRVAAARTALAALAADPAATPDLRGRAKGLLDQLGGA